VAIWGRIQTLLTGAALSRAGSEAVGPVLEPVRQHAWQRNRNRVLDPGTVAELRAQGLITSDDAQSHVARSGLSDNLLAALVALAQEPPGIGDARSLRRRKKIGRDELHRIYAKAQISPEWWDQLDALLDELLTPGELAAAIHRGLVPDPGLLKGEQPEPPYNVEAYPVYPIPTLDEAEASGYDKDRLGVLVGLQGLPMGVIEAAQAYYRGIITHGDYIRAFNESNNRNEWAKSVLEYARQIPTARDFFENALRGYHDLAWAQKQAERHGMSPADSLVIYQNQGRPMNIRQITQALSRGGVFEPEPGELPDPYDASVVEGNIKPAYYKLAKALKYTLPSPFVMRQLTASGVWSEAKAAKRLKDLGWIPQDADEAAKAWAGSGTTTMADPHIGKAQTQLWGTTHRSYIAAESDDAAASAALARAGVDAAAIPQVLALWGEERDLIRRQLTPAQIKKAYDKAAVNPVTGASWTRDDAFAALVERGYSGEQANAYLNIPSGP
jgi:hypothetical protein